MTSLPEVNELYLFYAIFRFQWLVMNAECEIIYSIALEQLISDQKAVSFYIIYLGHS